MSLYFSGLYLCFWLDLPLPSSLVQFFFASFYCLRFFFELIFLTYFGTSIVIQTTAFEHPHETNRMNAKFKLTKMKAIMCARSVQEAYDHSESKIQLDVADRSSECYCQKCFRLILHIILGFFFSRYVAKAYSRSHLLMKNVIVISRQDLFFNVFCQPFFFLTILYFTLLFLLSISNQKIQYNDNELC